MSGSNPDKQLAARIASAANVEEKKAISLWIERLLEIRASDLPTIYKAKQAIAVTGSSKVVFPAVKMIARGTKRLAWDERGLKGRLALCGSAVGVAFFGGQGAGIAALGTAIGVPLWVVLGAGAAFLGVLYEEITGKKPPSKTTYHVIEAESDEKN